MTARNLTLGLGAALLAAASLPAVAAGDCKQLSRQDCQSSARCGWVQGYERKDGREVASYCRSKPVPKKTGQAGGRSPVTAG